MDEREYLIMVKGKERTGEIDSFQLKGDYCEISFNNSHSRPYNYLR